MQELGYVVIGGRRILLLVRREKYGRRLKVRTSGQDGTHLIDEQEFLESSPEHVERIQAGEVVYL